MADDHNNRVTTREFYDELMKQNAKMEMSERRIVGKLDEIKACFNKESKELRKEIADVRVKSNRIDGVISAVVIAVNFVAITLGIRNP